MVHPYIYGSYKLNGKVNGNAFYQSMFQNGKYGIWRCRNGIWTIGLSKDKNKYCTNITKAAISTKSSYICPDDIKNDWKYYNTCAKWWYPVGNSLLVLGYDR